MSYVENELILRKIEHFIKRECQFHRAQIGCKMPARLAYRSDQLFSDALGKLRHLLSVQLFEFVRQHRTFAPLS